MKGCAEMKTGKRVCALLLALTLVLSIAMQPGIVGVWAKEDPEDGPDTQIEELLALAEESGEEESYEYTIYIWINIRSISRVAVRTWT